jgi:predicted component of type VI protein secretion system
VVPVRILAEDADGRRATGTMDGREPVVGRAAGCGLRLDDRNVSRRHCRLLRSGGALLVEDLGSSNGTRVNGQLLTARHRLREGDVVEVGDWDLAVEGPGLWAADLGAVTASTPLSGMRLPPLVPRAGASTTATAASASGSAARAAAAHATGTASPGSGPAQHPAPAGGAAMRRALLLVAVAVAAAVAGYGAGRVLRAGPEAPVAGGR